MAKVLTIDDSHTILKMMSAILKSADIESVTAHSAKDGLKKARSDKPDIILLDRQMPDMDGNEVLMALKSDEDMCNIPVIMLTGDRSIADISSCLELGAVDYIVKPFDAENLIARLKKVLRDAKL